MTKVLRDDAGVPSVCWREGPDVIIDERADRTVRSATFLRQMIERVQAGLRAQAALPGTDAQTRQYLLYAATVWPHL